VAAGLSNIEYVHCLADDPQLPVASADTIVIVNTFHHFADRRAYVAKLRKALLPGGRIVNIDFIPKPREQRGFGPPLEMQLPRETVDADMAAAGLRPARVHEFLPEQYFVEYRP
ncbi:MAG: methyltransferase domain-containing protein, partial [Planctomycetota bacterium]